MSVASNWEITTSTSCHDLALPKEVLLHPEKWNQKMVVIVGESTSRPDFPGLAWYDIKDRRVEAGGCGSSTIYVESIKLEGH
jgi:hypothetical protein